MTSAALTHVTEPPRIACQARQLEGVSGGEPWSDACRCGELRMALVIIVEMAGRDDGNFMDIK